METRIQYVVNSMTIEYVVTDKNRKDECVLTTGNLKYTYTADNLPCIIFKICRRLDMNTVDIKVSDNTVSIYSKVSDPVYNVPGTTDDEIFYDQLEKTGHIFFRKYTFVIKKETIQSDDTDNSELKNIAVKNLRYKWIDGITSASIPYMRNEK